MTTGVTGLPVFLVSELPAAGTHTVLDGPEGRHAAVVRRLRPGEELVLSDGRGGLARCQVDRPEQPGRGGAGRDSLPLTVLECWTQPPPALRVRVAQALIKGDRGELAVELATEAGADGLVPWQAERCVARWEAGPRGDKALARWRNTAREAAKQARRAWLPEVAEPVSTAGLTELVRSGPTTLVLHESARTGLGAVGLPASGELLLVVGPEGGITEAELAALVEAGAHPVRLGTTVLRASTAAAVALGAIGALAGAARQWS
ncbi:16S rRNA (uracil1498-N3)-methyltransferase [Goodfellowiella coeruleoviolacea]|uniref:Ribosomal RNA small subunit methyltransferase E n=1 Tax=Goodfellowiella coeruleoviolacea TaxID=334858 RepID=A0AAE3GBP1_9PSEU|nr:16S rRNA (uracil1498-N3)-methyltransferase [Goodfellowiella coeruleoviolacea]